MKTKQRIVSVRPSPLASIAGIFGLAAMSVFALSAFPDSSGGFLVIWGLACLGGIIYFIANLLSFSKSDKSKIPATADDVIEFNPDDEETSARDFETRP